MSFLTIYLFTGLVILGTMLFLWLASLALKNSSIVDIFWGLGLFCPHPLRGRSAQMADQCLVIHLGITPFPLHPLAQLG